MEKFLSVFANLLVAGLIGFVYYINMGPVPDDFKDWAKPKISSKETEQVLSFNLQGDPETSAPQALEELFQVYRNSFGFFSDKFLDKPAPRARFAKTNEEKAKWEGSYAIPISDTEKLLSQKIDPRFTLEKWEYGHIVELLHVGKYEKLDATRAKLLAFIAENNLEIIGDLEEDYVRSPKIWGLGNKDKFLTIVRYRIKAPKHQ